MHISLGPAGHVDVHVRAHGQSSVSHVKPDEFVFSPRGGERTQYCILIGPYEHFRDDDVNVGKCFEANLPFGVV